MVFGLPGFHFKKKILHTIESSQNTELKSNVQVYWILLKQATVLTSNPTKNHTWMSHKSVSKLVVTYLKSLIHLLTMYPNFQQDIQVLSYLILEYGTYRKR